VLSADWTTAGGERVVKSWLRLKTNEGRRPAVIVAQNDEMASGARRAALAHDPEWRGVPVLGCDGLPEHRERGPCGRAGRRVAARKPRSARRGRADAAVVPPGKRAAQALRPRGRPARVPPRSPSSARKTARLTGSHPDGNGQHVTAMSERVKGQTDKPRKIGAGAQVVEHVRREIESGRLGPGDRLPPERELARKMGVSRPSLRSGLRTLQAMGIVNARRGAGTFIVEGPPQLGKAPLQFLAALHGFTLDQIYEARRLLEVGAAGLAAERAKGEQIAAMADEIAGMFATLDDPQTFLRHDLGFHRAVAAGSENPILATIIGTLTEIIWETGRLNMQGTSLRDSAETHRRIYNAIKARSAERSRREMTQHLEHARWEQVGRSASERRRAARPR
jgi:GntR family transcriptional repressor for pyruvate dehydrogenase complex